MVFIFCILSESRDTQVLCDMIVFAHLHRPCVYLTMYPSDSLPPPPPPQQKGSISIYVHSRDFDEYFQ